MTTLINIAHSEPTGFTPHGQIDCWREDSLLHFRAVGPFNLELIEDFARAQLQLFQTDPPKTPWGSVCTILESAVITLEGLALFERYLREPKPAAATPRAVAFVMGGDVAGKSIMVPMYQRIYREIGQAFAVFDDAAQARMWVTAKLA